MLPSSSKIKILNTDDWKIIILNNSYYYEYGRREGRDRGEQIMNMHSKAENVAELVILHADFASPFID